MKKLIKFYDIFRMKFMNPFERAEYYKKKIGVKMGNDCQVFNNVGFGSEPYLVQLGSKVKITNGTQFITHDGGMEVLRNLESLPNADFFGQIIIGNNVFIGNRTMILPGVTVGDNVVIGAGSIVTKDIPNDSVCAGVPAKVIRSIDEYKNKYTDLVDYTKGLSQNEKKKYLEKKFDLRR